MWEQGLCTTELVHKPPKVVSTPEVLREMKTMYANMFAMVCELKKLVKDD